MVATPSSREEFVYMAKLSEATMKCLSSWRRSSPLLSRKRRAVAMRITSLLSVITSSTKYRDESSAYLNPGMVEISFIKSSDNLLHEIPSGTEPPSFPKQQG
ncbi:hypothetical protein V6N11_039584 [Hibiscus sabdariffa]|uniref:Uncharacterized protein n=1 Tax=Hibiscus sabdariffa TaxID=183260 RepID=A0ABR2SNW6_9ROSI